MTNITEIISDNVDNVVLSNNFLIGKQIEIENHKEPIIQELAIETRRDLKKLTQKYSGLNRIFKRQKDAFRFYGLK